MRRTAWRLLVAASLICVAAAATRPHYGGTLRLQMRDRFAALDPGANENLAGLLYDRLFTFDDSAQPQPALATAWRHDADFKRWEFQLRQGVKFHDGTPLTATAAAAALERLGGMAQGDTLVVRSEHSAPRLLRTLAGASIWKRTSDGAVVGTGPFRVTAFEPTRRAVFTANDDYWGGRPYLDAVEVEMGRTLRDQSLDFDSNKADVVELGFGDSRRVTQNGKRVWNSLPVDLLALVFELSVDERLREAVALSIDRPTIHNVLLQKQGTPAGAILPQWLSGYAFLFPVARDLDRARQLGPGSAPMTVSYDPLDTTARLIAERIAVNARDAGVMIRPVAGAHTAAARIVRASGGSADPGQALTSIAAALGMEAGSGGSPETVYAAERAMLQGHRIVPLFHLPRIYGLSPRIKGWSASRWGGWKLDSVWLAP